MTGRKDTPEVLSALEFSSIAMGINALDQMVKVAPISIIDSRTICPGKYIIVFCGDVASVEYSYNKGIEIGSKNIIDKLYLPYVHSEVVGALGKIKKTDNWNAIGIIETYSVISGIKAADLAAKKGGVQIIEIRLAIGFGGKSYVKMMGDLDEVTDAMNEGVDYVNSKNMLCMETIIPRPHKEIKPYFL